MFPAQLVIDFAAEMRKPPLGWAYCPCGKLVALADSPVLRDDPAGVLRWWHRACVLSDEQEQRAKRARRRAR